MNVISHQSDNIENLLGWQKAEESRAALGFHVARDFPVAQDNVSEKNHEVGLHSATKACQD